jgi:hypothetical protein
MGSPVRGLAVVILLMVVE